MREENRKPGKRVMVVIDDNECSYYALMWVLNNLNDSIKEWPLVVLAAQPPTNCSYVVSAALGFARMHCPVSATMDLIKSAQERKRKLLLGLLKKSKTVCASRGVNVEEVLVVGDVKEAACSAIKKYNVNLIVVGEKVHETLKRPFAGSVSSYCVQNAKYPVPVGKTP